MDITSTTALVALATATLLYALAWFLVRKWRRLPRAVARLALLALFFGPLIYVLMTPMSAPKRASRPMMSEPPVAAGPPPVSRPSAPSTSNEASLPRPAAPTTTPAAPPATKPGLSGGVPRDAGGTGVPTSPPGAAPPAASAPPPVVATAPPPPPVVAAAPQPEPPAAASPSPIQAAPPAPRMPDVAARKVEPPADQRPWDIVPVFYGTDRKPVPGGKRLTYGSDRAGQLEVGRVDVSVPKSHQVPNIERPFAVRIPFTSITIYEQSEDPARHFTMREIKALSEDDFIAAVRARLATSQSFKDRALVFIHGYNTDFDFAIYRTAQMAYDLKFDGAPFVYSWPSASGVTGYVYDRDSAEQAEPHLKKFLNLVVSRTGAKSVSLIAHSMGNLPLLRVLRDLDPLLPEGVKLDQVILAAPDIDRTLFGQLAGNIVKPGRGVTLYASSNDRAMSAARLVTGGAPRAGDVPPDGPVILDGIDTIDISSTTTDAFALNHSLYAERTALINDIALLLQTGERPPDKRIPILSRIVTPRGDYWRYP